MTDWTKAAEKSDVEFYTFVTDDENWRNTSSSKRESLFVSKIDRRIKADEELEVAKKKLILNK